MKRILCSVPYGLAFRNLTCCDVLRRCEERGAEVTLLLPRLTPRDGAVIRQECGPGVRVLDLKPAVPSRYFTLLKFLKQDMYGRRTALHSFKVRAEFRRTTRPAMHYAARLAERTATMMMSETTLDGLLRRAEQPFEEYYRQVLRDVRPDVILVTKPGYHPEELPIIKVAQQAGIPVVSVDTTWDNMASKRPPYLLPDGVTVWNDRMREEAVSCYRFLAAHAAVTGGPQFDVFFRDAASLPGRAEYLSALALDPARQLITFTLNNPSVITPDNPLYVRMLLAALREGRITGRPNLVIRLHPWDRHTDYRAITEGFANVHVQRPFGVPESDSVFECIPTRDDVTRYGALMRHADVVINIASTTTLDAFATDKPVVNIAFDMHPVPPEASSARYYGYTHYKPIVDSGAVHVVSTPDELFAALNAYLADPQRDSDRRRAAVRRFLTYADDRSAARVADAIATVG